MAYTFGNTTFDQLLVDAFERAGINEGAISGEKVVSAQRSANLLMCEWVNQSPNLWPYIDQMIGLTPNQAAYQLPIPTSDVPIANLRTSTRQLNGTAFATVDGDPNGDADNAFDGNTATACTQTDPNGLIGYQWGTNAAQMIYSIGVQSNSNQNYTLELQGSQDGTTYTTIQSLSGYTLIPNTVLYAYPVGEIIWNKVLVPISTIYLQIVETGGATLDIQELYFNNNIQDTVLGRLSSQEYVEYPQKDQVGRPNSYWIDRQINPLINLWPVPQDPYNCLFIRRIPMMQDFAAMASQSNIVIPQRFFEALSAGLAFKLAVKYNMQLAPMLKDFYQESLAMAQVEDRERVPLRIYGQFPSSWGSA